MGNFGLWFALALVVILVFAGIMAYYDCKFCNEHLPDWTGPK